MKNYLFSICVSLLEKLGRDLHLSYKRISVYINLYLQGIMLIASTVPCVVVAIIQEHILFTIITSLNFCCYLFGFIFMTRHYKLPRNMNFAFDLNIVGCELYREGMAYNTLLAKHNVCTMQRSTDFCAIPSNSPYGGYKWPKLAELHRKLFGCTFDGAHDALADIEAGQKYCI